MFPFATWRYLVTAPLDERPPPKILHRRLLASPASSAVGVVASGWRERWEPERKKAPFLFHFFSSSLRGLISPIAQHASPSHGERLVCFCGQTALLRAGGRAYGRVGLCSNGWLEKVELASMSWKQIPFETNADQKYTAVFTQLWRSVYLRRRRGVWMWVVDAFTAPINTQNKMSVVGSDGEMISARSMWTSQSPQIHSLAMSWCGRDLVTMGMRQTVLSAQWLSGTRDCVMEGWTGRRQDKTCPPLALEAKCVTALMSFDVCVMCIGILPYVSFPTHILAS